MSRENVRARGTGERDTGNGSNKSASNAAGNAHRRPLSLTVRDYALPTLWVFSKDQFRDLNPARWN